jgi:hypothetical protein
MRISLRELMLVVGVAAVGLAGLKFASSGMLPIVQAMTGLLLLVFLMRAIAGWGASRAFAIGYVVGSSIYLGVVVLQTNVLPLPSQGYSLETPTETFGTESVLRWLNAHIVSYAWINQSTGKRDTSFRPTESEAELSEVVRIEVAKTSSPSPNGEEVGTAVEATDEAPVGGFGVGRRGRGGRGGGSRGGFVARLTPQQVDEYSSADFNRRSEIERVWNNPQGQQAILSGAPLSSIRQVTYMRLQSPIWHHFQKAGHCLWAIMIGYTGGSIARFYHRRHRADETRSSVSSGALG